MKIMALRYHLIPSLEAREGHLRDGVLLVTGFVSREQRRVGSQREMNTRESAIGQNVSKSAYSVGREPDIRNKVGLKLVQVDIQRAVEAERRGDRGHDLRDESVQVREARQRHAEFSLANIINSLIVDLYAYNDIDVCHHCTGSTRLENSQRTMKEQSECSNVVCVVSTELYGSTTELDSCGAGYTQNSSFDFFP